MKTPRKNDGPKVVLPLLVLPGEAVHSYRTPEWQWGRLVIAKKRQKVTVHHVVGGFAMVQQKEEKPYICPTGELTQKRQGAPVVPREASQPTTGSAS